MASKRKTISAVIAVALAAAILFGGTFAWQSINQTALNEVYGFVNPGGRLHDDFHEITAELDNPTTRQFDKNVYVENFTTVLEDGVQIFARIRLDEYMEVGTGAGTNDPNKAAKSLDPDPTATFEDKSSWRTHIYGDTTDPFHEYWTWDMAGDEATGSLTDGVWYMPTFNKNKDSVEPDVNGTFGGTDGIYTTTEDAFGDYVPYGENMNTPGLEIYDADLDTEDELAGSAKKSIEQAEVDGDIRTVADVDHHTEQTLSSKVITMESWLSRSAEEQIGPYWVWDEDGWAYWAQPIDPSTATGVFLDGIGRTTKIINEDWYYGINVVAQFITADGLGREEGTGFYSVDKGEPPSYNALKLLNTIGVEVGTKVSDAATLDAALALGGNVVMEGEIMSTAATTFGNFDAGFAWTAGGTLSGGTLTTTESAYAGVFINNEKDWPTAGDGANEATMNGTMVKAENTNYGLYIQAIDAPVILNGVTVTAQNGGIYAEWSKGGKVTLNDVTVTASGAHATDWVNAALAAANGAVMEINGGTYSGKYAVYVYSSGGTITINDGTFTGKLRTDAGDIVIKGGTFTVDPTQFVAEGYEVMEITNTEDVVVGYEVSKIVF